MLIIFFAGRGPSRAAAAVQDALDVTEIKVPSNVVNEVTIQSAVVDSLVAEFSRVWIDAVLCVSIA